MVHPAPRDPECVRNFDIGGMTIEVRADVPINDWTFAEKFRHFETRRPGEDVLAIRHHFSLPRQDASDPGREVYRRAPWSIRRRGGEWVYAGISPDPRHGRLHCLAVVDDAHSRAEIFADRGRRFRRGNLDTLTMFSTDQVLLAAALAPRGGAILHAAGAIIDGKGLLFAGHSGAGKSTTVRMLRPHAQILCDDRVIVRRAGGRLRVYGTWCHGDVAEVSGGSAPLAAVFFPVQARENRLVPVTDAHSVVSRLLACLVKPLVTSRWWEQSLDLVEAMVRETRFYEMRFDKSGGIAGHIREAAA